MYSSLPLLSGHHDDHFIVETHAAKTAITQPGADRTMVCRSCDAALPCPSPHLHWSCMNRNSQRHKPKTALTNCRPFRESKGPVFTLLTMSITFSNRIRKWTHRLVFRSVSRAAAGKQDQFNTLNLARLPGTISSHIPLRELMMVASRVWKRAEGKVQRSVNKSRLILRWLSLAFFFFFTLFVFNWSLWEIAK